jgi:ParB family chromosome partitioning protein
MAKSRSGLGRDFYSLLDDNILASDKTSAATNLRISQVEPRSDQPRKEFSPEALGQLADSIAQFGVLQPIIVRESAFLEGNYEIIAGERRWRASKMAGLSEIPAVILDGDDLKAAQIAVIENVQREDLNPVEEAFAYDALIERFGLTQEQVSKSVGKSRPYIANCLRLLKLPEKIREYLADGSLSTGHAKAIAAVADEERQVELAETTIKEGLSVRQLEKLAKEEKVAPKPKSRPRVKNADVKRVEEDLKLALGTKVNLNQKGKKGIIEIEYYSKEELERLIELLKNIG